MFNLIKILFIVVFYLHAFFVNAQVFIPQTFWQCTSYSPSMAAVSRTLRGSPGINERLALGACGDDASNGPINIPFNVTISGTAYTVFHLGSNTYITANTGFTAYSGLGAGTPNVAKLHLGSGDNNYRYAYYWSGKNFTRVRYEGNAPYTTCATPPNTIIEVTFFRPVGLTQYIEVVFGTHGRTNGQFGIANATTYLASAATLTANTSYVFATFDGGTTWSLNANSSIVGNCINY